MRIFALLLTLTALGAPAAAWAHGPQIQLTAEGGKIITRQVMIDHYAPVTAATSIYVLPVANVSNRWLVQPPGTTGSGPGIAAGVGFIDAATHPFKSGAYTTSVADGLKKWNGSSFVDAGVVQLELYKTVDGIPTTAATTDGAPFAGITFNMDVADEEAHTGMGYRFLGDGVSNNSPLADGVYLLSLQVSTAGLTDSDPFYFVLPKGVSAAEAGVATFALAQQQGVAVGAIQAMTAIPEPTGLMLAAFAIGGCVVAQCRRRDHTEA